MDDLLVTVLTPRRNGSQSITDEHGFRVGFKGIHAWRNDEKFFINNHQSFRVIYNKDPETDSTHIVRLEVTPNSINNEWKDWDDKNP